MSELDRLHIIYRTLQNHFWKRQKGPSTTWPSRYAKLYKVNKISMVDSPMVRKLWKKIKLKIHFYFKNIFLPSLLLRLRKIPGHYAMSFCAVWILICSKSIGSNIKQYKRDVKAGNGRS